MAWPFWLLRRVLLARKLRAARTIRVVRPIWVARPVRPVWPFWLAGPFRINGWRHFRVDGPRRVRSRRLRPHWRSRFGQLGLLGTPRVYGPRRIGIDRGQRRSRPRDLGLVGLRDVRLFRLRDVRRIRGRVGPSLVDRMMKNPIQLVPLSRVDDGRRVGVHDEG
jgi:hypothetical protein